MAERRKRGRPKTDSRLDNWFGVEDARERKRIQDRLAQRARRDRLLGCEQRSDRTSSGSAVIPYRPPGDSRPAEAGNAEDKSPDQGPRPRPTPHRDSSSSTRASLPVMRIEVMCRSLSAISKDHYFLCWPAWPIYSALTQHGLMQRTNCPDATEERTSPPEDRSLPESLRPTPLQLAKPHKQWIDRFPFARMRDNMIILTGVVDLDDFVGDLFGMASLVLRPDSRRATWDPESWTFGTEFSSKWGYLFL